MTLMGRYTPTTLDNIKLDDKILDPIIAWANLWLNRLPDPSRPGLLLYGYSGTGKTLLSRCLARDCNWNIIELNASDVRTREQMLEFKLLSSNIFERDNCVLLDEIDSSDKGAEAIIKNIIMKAKFPVILTANNLMKVPKSIRDVCETIQVYLPSVNSLKQFILQVIKKENLIIQPDIIEAAANSQDYRMAFNIIENGIILNKKTRGATLTEQTSGLMNHTRIKIEELRSLPWYIEENSYKHYDTVDLQEVLEIISCVDKYKKRGQEKFALKLLKEIPRTDINLEEVNVPIYFEKEREKSRKHKRNKL